MTIWFWQNSAINLTKVLKSPWISKFPLVFRSLIHGGYPPLLLLSKLTVNLRRFIFIYRVYIDTKSRQPICNTTERENALSGFHGSCWFYLSHLQDVHGLMPLNPVCRRLNASTILSVCILIPLCYLYQVFRLLYFSQ